jgi:hypothetical protein
VRAPLSFSCQHNPPIHLDVNSPLEPFWKAGQKFWTSATAVGPYYFGDIWGPNIFRSAEPILSSIRIPNWLRYPNSPRTSSLATFVLRSIGSTVAVDLLIRSYPSELPLLPPRSLSRHLLPQLLMLLLLHRLRHRKSCLSLLKVRRFSLTKFNTDFVLKAPAVKAAPG